jgi:hypothetical protein
VIKPPISVLPTQSKVELRARKPNQITINSCIGDLKVYPFLRSLSSITRGSLAQEITMLDLTQLLILGAVVALGYFVFNGSRHDPREPPLVTSGIPILGHMFGMLWHGVGHWGNQA